MTTATAALLYGQGVSFPPRVGPDGSIVWSRGELNVRECIATLLRTVPGERVELPAYGCGLRRYLFEPNSVTTLQLITEDVQQAVALWEPRVRLDGVDVSVNAHDPRAVDISVRYTLVATGLATQLEVTIAPDGSATEVTS